MCGQCKTNQENVDFLLVSSITQFQLPYVSLQGIMCCGDITKLLLLTRSVHGNVEKEIFSITSSLSFEIIAIILGDVSQECCMITKRAS